MKYHNDKSVICEVDFDEIYLIYYPRLFLFALKLTGSREESEEIIQDVFIRLWQKEGLLEIKYSIRAYLFRAVHNACFDYLKKQKNQRKITYADFTNVDKFFDFQDPILLEELELAIKKSIDMLPNQCKKVFMMHRYEDLSYRKIAHNLNISIKTVETQISRAIKSLRKSMIEYLPQLFL